MSAPEGGRSAAEVLRVGLTGGIATGKSVVAETFREEGAFVLDADSLGHALMEPGTPAHAEIRTAFGDSVLAPSGAIDRKKLGARIFADPAERRRLNGILHPRILREVEERVGEFSRRSPGGMAVVQAALVVEAEARSRFDRIVVTHCDPGTQAQRLRERDGISEEEARRRIDSQVEARERLEIADYVVDTSGSLDQTRARAKEIFGILKQEWEERRAAR